MFWEFMRGRDLVGIQQVGDGWQIYLDIRDERGPIEAEVTNIPDAEIQRLYKALKRQFEPGT